jgi:hypothetical protein
MWKMTTEAPPRPRKEKVVGGQLIVAGFHRSGTSAAARLLAQGGAHMGDDLVGARLSNPFGHYEDVAVVRLHEALLADNGRTWQVDDEFRPLVSPARREELRAFAAGRRGGHRIWGFKDPRVCLFLPVWKDLLPEVRVIVVFRHYAEAVASLHRREARLALAGEDPQGLHHRFWEVPGLALRMWLAHNRALLSFAGEHRGDVLAVSFDDLRAGMPLLSALKARWGLGLRMVATFEAVQPGFPEPEHLPLRPAPERLVAEAEEVLGAFEGLAAEAAGEGGGGA